MGSHHPPTSASTARIPIILPMPLQQTGRGPGASGAFVRTPQPAAMPNSTPRLTWTLEIRRTWPNATEVSRACSRTWACWVDVAEPTGATCGRFGMHVHNGRPLRCRDSVRAFGIRVIAGCPLALLSKCFPQVLCLTLEASRATVQPMFTGHINADVGHGLQKLCPCARVPATLQTGDARICPQAADS